MLNRYIVCLGAVVMGLSACRPPSKTVTEGTRVALPPPPDRAQATFGDLSRREGLEDGLQRYLAGDCKGAAESTALRRALAEALAKRLTPHCSDDVVLSVWDGTLALLHSPDPSPQRGGRVSLLGAPGSVPSPLKKLALDVSRRILDRFEIRGDVEQSLVAHAVRAYFGDSSQVHVRRFSEILDWLAKTKGRTTPAGRAAASLPVLTKVAGRFPSPLVLTMLRRYARLSVGARTESEVSPSVVAAMGPLLAGDVTGALRAVEALPRPDKLLVALLRALSVDTAVAADFLALSRFFEHKYPFVSEVVCRMSAVRFPKAAEGWFCLGALAEGSKSVLRALVAYDRAVHLNPGWKAVWDKLAKLYMMRLGTLVERQDFDAVGRLVALNVKLHRAAMMRWPADPLEVGMAWVYFADAQARAARGDMVGAMKAYARSLKYQRRPSAFVEMGNIEFWRGRYRNALKYYGKALDAVPDDGRRVYWLSKVARSIALCHQRLGQKRQARFVLIKAAGSILRLATLIRDKNLRAKLLVETAYVVDTMGRRDHALRLLEIAVDTTDDLESIFPRVMTFYVSRGLVDQALDMYTRASTKDVAEYHRAYATFWVLNLGKRCGVELVRLSAANKALAAFKGTHWYDRLAAWMRGELNDAQVAKYAKRPGDRLELTYYRAMRALGAGRLEEAKSFWHQIKKTDMYVYFEYQMADWYLRHGAPCAAGSRAGTKKAR